ncbi:MAG: tetratricopeptide repeat protein [Candidatus Solibacter sp.]|nr:tetratricopeptide repeat protein [Candidatus Solibacter sp.]
MAPARNRFVLAAAAAAAVVFVGGRIAAQQGSPSGRPTPAVIAIDYPLDESVFPPEITAPTFLWRDASPATSWSIDIEFADGSPAIHTRSAGAPPRPGEIDQRAASPTNQPPEAVAAHAWRPDEALWSAIKQRSVERPAAITISAGKSRARVSLTTSRDPVGAPIFYRDVPLMPSEVQKGVIKPLAPAAIPLIGWRLRDIAEPRGRLLLEGLHSCTNCHSFSRDGKTLGMDVDGPENDKGTYAIVNVAPRTYIRTEDVITWNSFPGKLPGGSTIGFLSQISPDGQYAVSTVNEQVYVENFTDYRFLQVFYPTRGILAIYNRATRAMASLPGADDARFVQSDAVWSPDGQYLVFARAAARDAYPAGRQTAKYAGDPNELPMQYDLYRVPFNSGRGGRAEAIAGASGNGMSNTFPKVSPQLMRPDSQLYIVPAEGGQARRMRCNTPLMNSWHSFSPNGRWLVFSSKSRGPYTQMFLTHLDEEGRDTPAILIENATASNRAVNLPEFVNIAAGGLVQLDVPAAEFYRLFDSALELERKGRHAEAVAEWRKAIALDPVNAKAHTNLGIALANGGARDAAIAEFQQAVRLNPDNAEAHNNLGVALVQVERYAEAIAHFRTVLEGNPESAQVLNNLAVALMQTGKAEEAIPIFRKLLEDNPRLATTHASLGDALLRRGRAAEALTHWRQALAMEPDNVAILVQTAWLLSTSNDASLRDGVDAVKLAQRAAGISGGQDPAILDTLAAAYAEAGRFGEAAATARRAQGLAVEQRNPSLAELLRTRVTLYEGGAPLRVR